MRLNSKVPLIATIGVVLVSVVYCAMLFFFSFIPSIEQVEQERMNRVAVLVETVLQGRSRSLASVAEVLAEPKETKTLVANGDRAGLIQALQSIYELQHDRYGIDVLNIIKKPAQVIVHFQNIKKIGDDVSDRNMVITANTQQKTIKGVEIGRAGVAIRAMTPLILDQKMVGIIEVGADFSDITKMVKTATGFEFAVFVNQSLLAQTAKDLASPETDELVGGLRVLYYSDWKKVRNALSADALRGVHDTVFYSKRIDGRSTGVVMMPLQDFSGATIGAMVAVRDFEGYQSLENEFLLDALCLSALEIIFLIGMIWVLFRGWILRPLHELTTQLECLTSKNKVDKVDKKLIYELAKYPNEIGEAAQHIATLLEKKSILEKKTTEATNSADNNEQRGA